MTLVSWRKNKYICVSGLLIIGVAGGVLLDRMTFQKGNPTPCASDLQFIKSDLDCGVLDTKIVVLSGLQTRMKVLIEGYENTGKAKRVGVFVRDLGSNRFAGVNDNDVYYMASLLKLPVLIGGYKLAEVEPRILDQEILYTGTPNLYGEQLIRPVEELIIGKKYSIKELMRRTVVFSDNTAAELLFNYYPSEFIDRILQALAIQTTRPTGETENFITPRTYSGVYRMLYNASYLTEEYSNAALATLTQATFSEGATAKLPPSVVVARKFAERSGPDPSNPQKILRQLHECGIVYAKQFAEPYSFCIMTEGSEYQDLQEVLQDISLDIYNSMIDGRN